MTPDLSWFGLVWTALLFWVLVGWCPTGPDEADEPGAPAPPATAGRASGEEWAMLIAGDPALRPGRGRPVGVTMALTRVPAAPGGWRRGRRGC